MKITVPYEEIADFIEKRFKIRLTIATIGEKTCEVSYKPLTLFPAVAVTLHLEEVGEEVVLIHYDCPAVTSLMIAGGIAYLKEKIPSGFEVDIEEKCIRLYPQKIEQLNKVLERVTLSDIGFEGNSIFVGCSMV